MLFIENFENVAVIADAFALTPCDLSVERQVSGRLMPQNNTLVAVAYFLRSALQLALAVLTLCLWRTLQSRSRLPRPSCA